MVSTDSAQMAGVGASLDVLLATASANLEWSTWLGTLRPNATCCLVGATPEPVSLPTLPMILRQLSFCGSVIGPPRQIGEMLRFVLMHNVRAAVEVLPMEEVNLALQKVRRNQARYRVVLTAH